MPQPPSFVTQRSRLAVVCETVSASFLILALGVSLFAYGSKFPAVEPWLIGMAGLAGCFWGAGKALRRRAPAAPWLIALAAALLIQGWFMTIVAGDARPSGTGEATAALRHGIGAVNGTAARISMLSISAALLCTLVAADLGDKRWFRRLLLGSMWVMGLAVVGLALLQKLGVLEFWYARRNESSVFGVFEFHGHAGSYLLLILPIATVFGIRPRAPQIWLLTTAGLLLIGLGVATNISDAAQLIAIAMLVMLIVGLRARGRAGTIAYVTGLGALAVTSAMALAVPMFASVGFINRLQQVFPQDGVRGRLLMWRSATGLVREAGALGLGPGSFKLVLTRSTSFDPMLYRNWIVTPHQPGMPVSFWSHASNDYLQGLIEWGVVGSCLFAVLLAGAVIAAGRVLLGQDRLHSEEQYLRLAVFVALLGLLLHAGVESPLQSPPVQLHVGVLVGLAWSSLRWDPPFIPSPATAPAPAPVES